MFLDLLRCELIDNMLEKLFSYNGRLITQLFKRTSAKGTYQFSYENNETLVSYKPENDIIILLLFFRYI